MFFCWQVDTLREHFSLNGMVYDVELINAESDECRTAIISFDSHLSAEKAFQIGKSLKGHDLQFTWVSGDIRKHDKTSSEVEEPMDVERASQNTVLQKEYLSHPDEDSKATAEDIIEMIADPEEKLSPHTHKELVEGQPSVCGEEKAWYSQPAEDDFMKQEEQVSNKGYAEKADDENSHNDDSLKTLDNQNFDEELENEEPLSGDESCRSY